MITIISSTNRRNSVSRQIAQLYQRILQDLNEPATIIDLAHLPTDFTSTALYENRGTNPDFNLYVEQMKKAEKYVFIIPEYNGSFPGVLKAFLDGLEFPGTFQGKKCALVGLSAGVQGGVMAMSHLTDIFNYLGMNVLALKPKLIQVSNKLKQGEITDEADMKRLVGQAKAFLEF